MLMLLSFFFLIPLILNCTLEAVFKVRILLTFTYQLTFQKEPHKIDTGKGVQENPEQSSTNSLAGVASTLYWSENVPPCPLEL